MNLKNALAICLISVVSATLVVLIARSLDLQAASRLEPSLAQIAEDLHALRESGGISASSDAAAGGNRIDDGLVVYYFHGKARCPTCRSIESQSHDAVTDDFAAELDAGRIAWRIVNYEQPAGETLKKKFEIMQPVVVLAQMQNGRIADWKPLDQVWALVGDKPAFRKYVREEIAAMLDNQEEVTDGPGAEAPAVPVPDVEPSDLPLPADSGGIADPES